MTPLSPTPPRRGGDGGITLASGQVFVEQHGDEIRIVIPCPTTEEADLTFDAIVRAWNRTGKLTLTKRGQQP